LSSNLNAEAIGASRQIRCTITVLVFKAGYMKLLRLPRAKVRLGMPLPWNVRDEQGHLLLSRGHVVESEHQLESLLLRGAFVDAQEARAVEHQEDPVIKQRPSPAPNLFSLWDKSADEMRKLMIDAPAAPRLVQRVGEFAAWLIELVDKDVDIALYRSVRQESQDTFFYGFNHSVHTAVLCLLMARRLHWPEPRMMSLVKAAITMNISTLELQGHMADQDVPMKDSQKKVIRRHPQDAADWLIQAGVTDADWLVAVAQHHERIDGSGYPLGLANVADIAVALRVTDVFMAKISPRKLRPSLSAQEAAKQLFREDQGGPMSNAIIKEFGIFPPGELVKLASGETGVVMRRTGNVKCPIVAAITDSAGRTTVHTLHRDTAKPEYAIVGTVADKSLVARMPPERVYGYASLSLP
jgi:HD-GYP domain-containing protein (c-di-GMP phosphodiesterase class II)